MKNINIDIEGQSEDALQQKCYFWFHNTFPHLRKTLFSVPNGGLRDKKEARKLKSTGLVPGVSDLIFAHKGRVYFIELKKSDDDNQSKSQVDFQKAIENQSFRYLIIRTLRDFKELINNIVNGNTSY